MENLGQILTSARLRLNQIEEHEVRLSFLDLDQATAF
jgi:uncharacterized protein (UPF0303 family)